MTVKIKRIYEAPSKEDGKRILVDRVWPRGITKERAALDMWLKDAAPNPELRKWYGHRVERYEEFKEKYEKELAFDLIHLEAVEFLCRLALQGDVTLVFAARDVEYSHAVILRDWVESKLSEIG